MNTATKSLEDKPNKKRLISVRIAMTLVFAAAWLIPIVFLSFFIFNNYQKAYIEKSENLMQNAVNVSTVMVTTDIDAAIAKALKPTYEGEWESLYTKYEKGIIPRADFLVGIKSSLVSKFYMDEQFTRYAYYLPNGKEPCCYSGKNGYSYEKFIEYVQPVAIEVQDKNSNYIELHVIDNQLYLIRNLYTVNDYRKYATLVLGIDKNLLFDKLPLEIKDNVEIKVRNKVLRLSDIEKDDFSKSDFVQFTKDYSCDNYELSLSYFEDKAFIDNDVRKLNSVVNIIIFAMLPLMALSYLFLTNQIEKPLRTLTDVSKRMRDGELGSTVDTKMPNKEFEGLSESFNAMSTQVKHLVDTVYLEQIATKDALIDSLQAQINPHFLNNTLEMMNWQARMNGDIETCKMVESLGTVLDFSMNRNHNRLVRLSDELHCAEAFLYIMSMRFGQRLVVEKEVEESLYGEMVPSLVLQPLLENAIKHGVEKVSQGTIWLKIYKNECIYIDVINTGKPVTEADMERTKAIIEGTYKLEKAEPGMHTSIGIYNVNKRIRLLFGGDYGLTVSLTEEGNFMSRIKIPVTGGPK